MPEVYYNDNDAAVCRWLRELMKAKVVSDGTIDERSITKVAPADLVGYRRVHLFAGIAGWDYALRLAGWGEEEVWTCSCPCPPFSSAGKKKCCPQCGGRPVPCPRRTGFFICLLCRHAWLADARHLWPEAWRLIAERRPPIIVGEQVASDDGRIWLAGVRASLEMLGYAVGAADLCAASVGAPNIRQRLFWVADSSGIRRGAGSGEPGDESSARRGRNQSGTGSEDGRLANSTGMSGPEHVNDQRERPRGGADHTADSGGACRLANTTSRGLGIDRRASRSAGHADQRGAIDGLGDSIQPRLEGHAGHGDERDESRWLASDEAGPVTAAGPACFWIPYDLIPCRDGKARRVEPGTFPLAHGVPARVVRLRGYGNAINPQVAAAFIKAVMQGATS